MTPDEMIEEIRRLESIIDQLLVERDRLRAVLIELQRVLAGFLLEAEQC